jgi:simple sugar transport system substrate-binding protein
MLALSVVITLISSSCSLPDVSTSAGGQVGQVRDPGDLTFAVITHASPGDAFWDRVQSGARKAGSDYDVTVEYSSDPDPGKQSVLIDQAVASKVDGIVVSMANPDGLETSVKRAVSADIPVVTINSGLDQWEEFGAITHVGQSETIAGEAAGERLKEEGVKNLICVIQEAGNVGLEQRCAAVKKTLGGTVENLQVDGTSDAAVNGTIKAKLQQDPSIDGVLTLGGQFGIQAVRAADEAGSDATIATFDLSADVIKLIRDDKMLFAVDQQPFVQGYLGVTALYLRGINGNDIGGGLPIYSGPTLITKQDAAEILPYAEGGTR